MAEITPTPLGVKFPRYHASCDCCEQVLGPLYRAKSFDTAAASFRMVLCFSCLERLEAESEEIREFETKRCLVRHAGRYSPVFAEFVAAWYGIEAPAMVA